MTAIMLDYTPGSKSPVTTDVTNFRSMNLKLYVFGNITTETAPKSLHVPCLLNTEMWSATNHCHIFVVCSSRTQVADATIGNTAVKFYMNSSGYDKLTSVTPCAPWLMKVLADADPQAARSTRSASTPPKSSMEVGVETSVLKVSVARSRCSLHCLVSHAVIYYFVMLHNLHLASIIYMFMYGMCAHVHVCVLGVRILQSSESSA